MLSPHIITILTLIVTVIAYPPIQNPLFKRPVTSLKNAELEDVSPWIKFPFFGNILESFPNFLPTIPEAGPKIENDSQKFQVIINVKGYKKDFLKVKEKGSFIIIQGAHEDVQDNQSFIDSQFLQTYTLPLKASVSSIRATLTSDGYLVVTVPIGNVINKLTYSEKEISIIESREPLLKPEIDDKNNVSSTSSPVLFVQVTPSTILLPPNPLNEDDKSSESLIPTIPSTSLLPPKLTNVEASDTLSMIQVPLSQVNYNPTVSVDDQSQIILSTINTEKKSDEIIVVPTIITIPLQEQNEVQQIIVAPTYTPVLTIQTTQQSSDILNENQNNNYVQLEENVPASNYDVNDNNSYVSTDYRESVKQTTETLEVLDESTQGYAIDRDVPTPNNDVNDNNSHVSADYRESDKQITESLEVLEEATQGYIDSYIPTTAEQILINLSNDINFSTALPLREPTVNNVITTDAVTIQSEKENTSDLTTETSSLQFESTAKIYNVLRSKLFQEGDSVTSEPEIVNIEEHFNEEEVRVQLSPEILSDTTTNIADVIATTTNTKALTQKDNKSELIIESSTLSQSITEEFNNTPTEFVRSENKNIITSTDNIFEGNSLSYIAIESYEEDVNTNTPKIENFTEQVILSENQTNSTSEVNNF